MSVAVLHRNRRVAGACLGSGLLLGVISCVLYASGLSRAVGVVIVPFAMALVGAGVYVYYTRRPLPRAVVLVFTVAVVLAAGYGVWSYIYGLMHPPMAA